MVSKADFEYKNLIAEAKKSTEKPLLLDLFYNQPTESVPVVVFCHGYKGYKDWGSWDLVARRFAQNGFLFCKFNFSFNGCTAERPNEFADLDAFGRNTYSREMEDVGRVLDWLQHYEGNIPEVNWSRIYLVGHSRGGGIATLTGRHDSRVAGIASWAGVCDFKSRFPEGEILDQWKTDGVYFIENARTKQRMPHYFDLYLDYLKHEENLNIEQVAKRVDKGQLIVHGSDDLSVLLSEGEALHKWCKDSIMKIIPGANHTFGTSEPWTSSDLTPAMNEVVDLTLNYFKS